MQPSTALSLHDGMAACWLLPQHCLLSVNSQLLPTGILQDVRCANLQGSLGAGLYFGTTSGMSGSYCGKQFNRAVVQTLYADSVEPTIPASPHFIDGCLAMLLCRVALGKAGTCCSGGRMPQEGCHSAGSSASGMHAVYRSDQVG